MVAGPSERSATPTATSIVVRLALGMCCVAAAGFVVSCGRVAEGDRRSDPGGAVPLDLGNLPRSTVAAVGAQPLTTAPISPLPAGTWRTTVGLEVTFTVDDRWDLEAMDETQGALLFGAYSPMDVTAPRVEWVDFTAAGARVVPSTLREIAGSVPADDVATWDPLPGDLAAWLAVQGGLDVGPIEQVELGGRPAASFMFTVADLPTGRACQVWPCLRLLGGADWGWPILQGDVGRMWIVDVQGHQILVQVRCQPADAAVVLPAGAEVVASMSFGSAR